MGCIFYPDLEQWHYALCNINSYPATSEVWYLESELSGSANGQRSSGLTTA